MTEPVATTPISPQLPLEPVASEDRAAALVALLFVGGDPSPLALLAQQIGCTVDEARTALQVAQPALGCLGLVVQWCGEERVQLATAPRFAPHLRRFLGLERGVRLSQAALETLAIVAYRQPITRVELDEIRGVDSSGVLQTLIARGLIEATGRLPVVGNPIQYGTTPEFLRFFGLTSLDDLPPAPEGLIPGGAAFKD